MQKARMSATERSERVKKTAKAAPLRYKCRNAGCPNHYSDVIGGDKAFGAHKAGAECVPCLYANQMVDQGTTPEQVEAVPHLMEMFLQLLGNTGWTWQHVKDCHARMAGRVQ
jgi:hypothetical protein